jgi:hypothetical protein
MEKGTRNDFKRFTSYARMIKGSRTIGQRKGKLISGQHVSIPEDVVQLELSMLRDYEQQFDFKFPLEKVDYFDYFLPV